MGLPGALFATTAFSAVNSIAQGYAEKGEMEANATIANSQANLIKAQSEIEYAQYERLKGKYKSESMANVAKAGLMPGGSSMAAIVGSLKNITIDQIIGQFNYNTEIGFKKAEAETYSRKGKLAARAGWMKGLSEMMRGGTSYAMYKGFGRPNMGGGGMSQYGNKYGINTPTGTFDMGNYSRIKL